MLEFLKRKSNPSQIAAYITLEPSTYSEGIEEGVEKFLEENPQYRDVREKLLDECQWIIAACGIISIGVLTDVATANEVRNQIGVVLT